MNIDYRVPTKSELVYRKFLLADQPTMEYNKKWGWTVDFSEDKWDTWYEKWITSNNPSYFYNYVVVDNEIVGEIAYHFDSESKTAMLSIIIAASKRGGGIGKTALRYLIESAFKNGYDEVRDTVAIDNIGAQKLFESLGFSLVQKTDEYYDYRLKNTDK